MTTMTLESWVTRLETADAQIATENAALLSVALDDLTTFAQSIEHEQTGHMIETTHPVGPFVVAEGTLEGRVVTDATYADLEVARGDSHDWPTRTLNEDRPRITQLQQDAVGVVVRALVGGG